MFCFDNVHIFAFLFSCFPLLLLPVFQLVALSYAPPPRFQQPFVQCPGLPQFLHVLMSVELVLVVRFPLWCWFLHLPFLLPFLRESTCILLSSAFVPFSDDEVGFAPNFRESITTATGLRDELCCWHMYPIADCFQEKSGLYIHHHCVLDSICQRSSRSTFPLSDVQLPRSQC